MNVDFEDVARLAWTQLWQVTLVAATLGMIVKLYCRDKPRLAYALWMLVIAKAIIPPIWSSPTGLFCWALVASAEVTEDITTGTPPIVNPQSPGIVDPHEIIGAESEFNLTGAQTQDSNNLKRTLILIWLVGFSVCSIIVLARQLACSLLIKRSSIDADERHIQALAKIARLLGVKRRVRLVVSARPIGPAAFGFFRPAILMPRSLLADATSEQIELVLAHELLHVRRGDLFISRLQLFAQMVWWFHPLIWWANRGACEERERCCDEDVVAGVSCKPAVYAKTLLCVLEQRERLRALVAIPGVRALEVTSLRLEWIMKSAGLNRVRTTRISRLVFVCGLILLIPGSAMTLRARGSGPTTEATAVLLNDNAAKRTVRGVVREKGSGRPVQGVRVNIFVGNKGPDAKPMIAATDDAGRYVLTELPASREYNLIAAPKEHDSYFVTSRKIQTDKDTGEVTADVEAVRGIPLRVRVLDKDTGKPLEGRVSYFPINPNNPFERGAMGYSAVNGIGAFSEATADTEGQFHGAVLSGPGILGFNRPYKAGDETRVDKKPELFFPDGKKNIKLTQTEKGGPLGFVPITSNPISWSGMPLGQFDAVIAIDPKEGAEVATYEIRIGAEKRAEAAPAK